MRKLLEIRNFNIKVILLTKDNKYDYDDVIYRKDLLIT